MSYRGLRANACRYLVSQGLALWHHPIDKIRALRVRQTFSPASIILNPRVRNIPRNPSLAVTRACAVHHIPVKYGAVCYQAPEAVSCREHIERRWGAYRPRWCPWPWAPSLVYVTYKGQLGAVQSWSSAPRANHRKPKSDNWEESRWTDANIEYQQRRRCLEWDHWNQSANNNGATGGWNR